MKKVYVILTVVALIFLSGSCSMIGKRYSKLSNKVLSAEKCKKQSFKNFSSYADYLAYIKDDENNTIIHDILNDTLLDMGVPTTFMLDNKGKYVDISKDEEGNYRCSGDKRDVFSNLSPDSPCIITEQPESVWKTLSSLVYWTDPLVLPDDDCDYVIFVLMYSNINFFNNNIRKMFNDCHNNKYYKIKTVFVCCNFIKDN